MNPSDEVVSPAGVSLSPAPSNGEPGAASPQPREPHRDSKPTLESVLAWIAAADPKPWFPSVHAKLAAIARDSLDEPLNALRLAGLVTIAEWERGVGQGYRITPRGKEAVATAPGNPAPAGKTREAAPDDRTRLFDKRPPAVTPALLIANLIWFTAGMVVAWRLAVPARDYLFAGPITVLDRLGAVSAASLWHGDWWRLLTCCFVHVGFWHLLMNMIGLIVVGPVAEMLWGRKRMLAIYLLAGLGGACAAMALRPVDPVSGAPVLVAGASGAIWGLMGSLVAWLILNSRKLKRRFILYFASRLGFALVLNIGVSLLPGVSWEGHAGGGVIGFVTAAILSLTQSASRARRIAAVLLVASVPVLCVSWLVWSMQSGDRWAPVRHHMLVKESAIFVHRPPAPANRLVGEFATGAFLGIEAVLRDWMVNQELAGLLNSVSPAASRPLESRAVLLLSREPTKRKPEQTDELRENLIGMRKAAEELKQRLSPPTGDAAVDSRRAGVRAYAEARIAAVDLLVAMLDSKKLLDGEEREAWGKARREAERLWAEMNEPAPKK